MHVRDAPAGVDYGVVLPTVGWCPSARLAAWWAVRARLAAFVVATALEAAQSSQQASAAAGARGDVSASQPVCPRRFWKGWRSDRWLIMCCVSPRPGV